MQTTTVSDRRRGRRIWATALLAAAVLVAGCGGDDADTTSTATTAPVAVPSEGDAAGADEEFCELARAATAPVDRSHIGSPAHVDQLDALAEVAPATMRDDLVRLRDHYAEAVDPAEPATQDFENFPSNVQAIALGVQAYITSNC